MKTSKLVGQNAVGMANRSVPAFIAAALALFAGSAQATLVKIADDHTNGNQLAYAATVLNNDLINQGTATLLRAVQTNYSAYPFYQHADAADTVLNNGSIGSNTTWATSATSAFDLDGVFTITYQLNLATATRGYDLTRIRSYAAHEDNRTGQHYSVLVDYVDDGLGNFVSLGSFIGTNAGGSNQASRMTLANDTAPGVAAFASGVGAIQFITSAAGIPASTVWRELDVEGSATPGAVPEPSTAALLVAGFAALFRQHARRPLRAAQARG
jgi:hypothetical protein